MNDPELEAAFSWNGPTTAVFRRTTKKYYSSFNFGNLEVSLGDFVLIRNDETQKPESYEFCHVGKVTNLYESDSEECKHCCEVQWFLRLFELPKALQVKLKDPDFQQELILDQSGKWNKVIDAETIFKKCQVLMLALDVSAEMIPTHSGVHRLFFCRYALSKFGLEPVLQYCSPKKMPTTNAYTSLRQRNNLKTSEPLCNISMKPNQDKFLSNDSRHYRSESKSAAKSTESLKPIQGEPVNNVPKSVEPNKVLPNPNQRKALQTADIDRVLDDNSTKSSLQPTPVKRFYSSEKKRPATTPVDARCVQKKLFHDTDPIEKENSKRPLCAKSPRKKVSHIDFEKNVSNTRCKVQETSVTSEIQYKVTRSGRKVKRLCYFDPSFEENIKTKRRVEKLDVYNESDEYEKDNSNSSKSYESDSEITFMKKKEKDKTPLTAARRKIPNNKSHKPSERRSIVRIRKTQCETPRTPLEKARANLHVGAVPDTLPCRENEFNEVFNFVESKLLEDQGGCMYISGVPGTGKTATVNEVMRTLEESRDLGNLRNFLFLEINALRLTNPQQCYVHLLKGLKNITRTPEQALDILSHHFESGRQEKMVVLMLDELDMLWTRRQDVLYNLFHWPLLPHSRLVVLAIANTMDLPERLLAKRVASRLGLSRTAFMPYSYKQLQEIVMSRIEGLVAFNPDAVQLVARKVASVSGDARRALDICRRATELIKEDDGDEKSRNCLVDMKHVNIAIQEMFSSPKIATIRHASVHEKLFLRGVVQDFLTTGVEEATFGSVIKQHMALCRLDGINILTHSQLIDICTRLYDMRLIILDKGRTNIYQRIKLNLSVDDVNYALKDIKL